MTVRRSIREVRVAPAVVAVVVLIGAAAACTPGPSDRTPTPSLAVASPSPSTEGWGPGTASGGRTSLPGTTASPGGRYQWLIGSARGWMHRVNERDDPPEVEVELELKVEPIAPLTDGEPAAVAGYPGRLQESTLASGSRRLVWKVAIDDQRVVVIIATGPPGHPEADLQEAFEIVESMRHELGEGRAELLTFRLREGWDTG